MQQFEYKIQILFFGNGISFKTINGDISAVTEEMISSGIETTLPTLLSKYKLENKFNADDKFNVYQLKRITYLEKFDWQA